MKIVITGGSGFIGTNLMLYLTQREPDNRIVILDTVTPRVELPRNASYVFGDVRNLNSLRRAFAGADEVYHLAGVLGTSELNDISSLAAEVNIVGANNALDAALHAGVMRFYNVAKPHFDGYAENAYTLTKHAGELLGQMYSSRMQVTTLRWLNAVGAYQHLYPVRKFVPMQILLCMAGLPCAIYGDGEQTIDPIDARDVAAFTVFAMRHGNFGGRIVELGSGLGVTVNDATRIIRDMCAKQLGRKMPPPEHVPMRAGEKPGVNLFADMAAWKDTGIELQYSFEDAIQSAIDCTLGLPAHEIDNAMRFYGMKS